MEKPYTELPLKGPHDVGVGHALISMVEPHIGHERAYNRWYEDDHMFSGALYLPWLFSARRWNSPIAEPISNGCYLSTYWITPGRIDDHKEWSFSVYERLAKEDRVNDNRDHVFTSFQDRAGTIYRDDSVPNEVFTLLDPAAGLVMEIIDAPSAEVRDNLEKWILSKHLPTRVNGEKRISSAMVFRTRGLDSNVTPEVLERIGKITAIANDPCRLTILWFLAEDPMGIWDGLFVQEPDLIVDGGLGKVSFLAPFIPAKMGTNAYDDMLRAPLTNGAGALDVIL